MSTLKETWDVDIEVVDEIGCFYHVTIVFVMFEGHFIRRSKGRVQQNEAILLAESVNWTEGLLVRVQDQERGKMRCLLHGINYEGNYNGPYQDMKLKGELMFRGTVLEGKGQGKVQIKSSIFFKLVPMFLDRGPPSKAPMNF